MDQSLHMDVSGRIGSGLEVFALLSDQNTPIPPEGDTRALRELDKVLVRITGDHLSAALGDVDVSFEGTEFGAYRRRLEGIRGDVRLSQWEATVVGARSGGEFVSLRIVPIEGCQGPYQLTGKDGNANILVQSGTERIWLDGELLTRGRNGDYTIEYGAGRITFTARRPITGDSRIMADYECVQYGLKRSTVAGQARTRLFDGRLALDAAVIRESDLPGEADARDESLEIDLLALRSGMGPDIESSLLSTDSGRAEEHLPARHQLGSVRLAFNPVPRVRIMGEMGISDLDRDLSSSEEAGEPVGRAGRILGNLTPCPVRLFGRDAGTVEFSGAYRYVGPRFRPMGRIEHAEEARRWGENFSTALHGETGEVRAVYRPATRSGVELEYGRTRRNAETSATREGVRVWSSQGTYRIERIARVGSGAQASEILRQNGRIERVVSRLKPEIRFASERIEGDSPYSPLLGRQVGTRYHEIEAALSSVHWGPVFWSSGYGFRKAWSRPPMTDKTWADSMRVRSQRHELKLNPWRSISGSAFYSRRHNTFHGSTHPGTKTELVAFDVRGAPFDRALWGEIHYDHTNTQFMRKTRHFIDVGDGRGTYTWEDRNGDHERQEEEYVPDPEGRYILYIEDVSTSEPVTERSAGITVRVTPSKILESSDPAQEPLWRKVASGLSSESAVELSRKTRRDESGRLFHTGEAILRGRRTIHHDLHMLRYGRSFSLRLRYRRNDDLNREFSSGEDRNASVERSLRTRLALAEDVGLEVEYSRGHSERRGRGAFDFDLTSEEIQATAKYRPAKDTEIHLRLRARKDQDRLPVSPTVAHLFSVEPEISRFLREVGRLRLQAGWADVASDPADARLAFQMAGGKRQGRTLTWRCALDYRLGRYVTAMASYRGRKLPGQETTHTMRAEVNALF